MAFAFVLLSVALFIGYITHVANLIRVATIIHLIGRETRALIERRCRLDRPAAGPIAPLLRPAHVVPAEQPGVVAAVNEDALTELAERSHCVVVLVPRVGDYVPAGAPLLAVHPDGRSDRRDPDLPLDAELAGTVAFDIERTSEQDVAFGLRQLVDIAERALSPGVNDPTTAAQAVDELHDLLRRLAGRHLPDGCWYDDAGHLRLVVPQYTFADYLQFTVGEVWRYGAESAQIPARLAHLLADLGSAAVPEHRAAVGHWARIVSHVDGSGADGGADAGRAPHTTGSTQR